jgi:hypothetical protein
MAEDIRKTIARLHTEGVGGKTNIYSDTPTVTAGAYTAGDVVGGKIIFMNCLNDKSYSGVLQDMIIIDDAGQDANGAGSFAEADLENLIGVISTADGAYYASGTPSVGVVRNLGLVLKSTDRHLYCQLVTRGTPTYAATDDVTVKIGILQD